MKFKFIRKRLKLILLCKYIDEAEAATMHKRDTLFMAQQ